MRDMETPFVWEREAVERLIALGVSKTRIAKECGKSRNAIYKMLKRKKADAPVKANRRESDGS